MGRYREMLVAVAGLTPQIITETLYYLTQKRDPSVAIDEIYVLTTQPGRLRILTDLLAPDVGRFYAFCTEYDLDPTTRLHCSLAGGRKTQSALLGFALQLHGRPQDTLLHVLVDEALEGHRDFFYPTRGSRFIQIRDGGQIDARNAHVAVAEIPYVRLRDKLSTSVSPPPSGFAPTIERLQYALDTLPDLPPLVIEPAARKVCIGVAQIPLEPLE